MIRFKDVTFAHEDDDDSSSSNSTSSAATPILDQVNFTIAAGSKVTIMGQNGAGKSTLLRLITSTFQNQQQPANTTNYEGHVWIRPGERIAVAQQTIPTAWRNWTLNQYLAYHIVQPDSNFELDEEDSDDDEDTARAAAAAQWEQMVAPYELESQKARALRSVRLPNVSGDRILSSFSGGQQARLLLAAALIHRPTILLLDEPTNNLDTDGLSHLRNLIRNTADQTCVVISHDEDFLNSFTDQVLYLNVFTKTVESYAGNYYNVKTEIAKRIQRENAENTRRESKAQEKKEQANKFANKGGNLRKVAKTMRKVAAEMEQGLVAVRKEDATLHTFVIPYTAPAAASGGKLISISQVCGYFDENEDENNNENDNQDSPGGGGAENATRAPFLRHGPMELRAQSRVHLCGPNGIGKSSFLERIVAGTAPGVTLAPDASVGYYRQDFHNFDFNETVWSCLETASQRKHTEEQLFTTAAAFLLRGKAVMNQTVGTLSEGQKGLLSLACLTLQRPSILILDEVTNHINFRHIPALTQAIRTFGGAVLLVSHDADFVAAIGVDATIDMGVELADATALAASSKQRKTKALAA